MAKSVKTGSSAASDKVEYALDPLVKPASVGEGEGVQCRERWSLEINLRPVNGAVGQQEHIAPGVDKFAAGEGAVDKFDPVKIDALILKLRSSDGFKLPIHLANPPVSGGSVVRALPRASEDA